MRSSRSVGLGQGLFLRFIRENRPLSTFLRNEYSASALTRARELSPEECTRGTADIVTELIGALDIAPPSLGDWQSGRQSPAGYRPGSDRSLMIPLQRKYASIEVHGDAALLNWWPDDADSELQELDPWELGPDPWRDYESEYDEQATTEWYRRLSTRDLWSLNYADDADDNLRLYTFIDLSDAELDEVREGRRDVRADFEKARALIEPIVTAIRKQTESFVEHELVDTLTTEVENRKRQLSNRVALDEQLSWPVTWKQAAPRLDDGSVTAAGEGGDSSAVDAPANSSSAANDLAILGFRHKPRLSPATFDDVQRTIRVWADAVERYPRSFIALSEDQLSDLLAATLNAALPGAHREVYRRGGKTDIFITADILAEGAGPGRVFVCECKKWDGSSVVEEGFDQLQGYLDSQDTAAVLIVFNATLGHQEAEEKALAALRARSEYVGAVRVGAAGWPILALETKYGQTVELCLAVIDIDKPATPIPKKRRTSKAPD